MAPLSRIKTNVEVEPNTRLSSPRIRPSSLFQIYKFAEKEHKIIWIAIIVVALWGLAWPLYTILYALLFRTLSEALDPPKDIEWQNTRNGLLFLGLGVFGGVFRSIGGSLFGYLGQVISKKMRVKVFEVQPRA